jgi:hypothetical protein
MMWKGEKKETKRNKREKTKCEHDKEEVKKVKTQR